MSAEGYKEFLGDVDDMAAYWAVRLTSPRCTPEDRFAFEKWKDEDPAHAAAYEAMLRGNAFVDRNMTDPAIQELIEEARDATAPPVWRRRTFQYVAMAASLMLVVSISVLTLWRSSDTGSMAAAGVESYETEIGERSTVTLADGSIVTLNTNSRIEVDFSASARDVKLLRGQGFFEVAKDVDRPFTVAAGDKRVTALGTAFDVRFDADDRVEVVLVEGIVEFDGVLASNVDQSANRLGDPPAKIQLNPGERLVAHADTAPQVEATDVEATTSWRTGRLIFRDKPITEVVAEMNRYSVQKLALSDDKRVQVMRVSGVFDTGRASTFVSALELMHPLEAKRTGRNELMLVWQE